MNSLCLLRKEEGFKCINALLIFFIIIFSVENASAAEAKKSTVKSTIAVKELAIPRVQLIGNRKVTSEMVENLIRKNISYPIDESVIDRFLIALYNTNLFMDVKIDFDQSQNLLKIQVQENKIVRNLEIKKIKEVKDEELKGFTESRRMVVFNEYSLNQTIRELHEFYMNLGYINVEITKEIKDVSDDMVDVIVKVNKHKKLKIEQITFIGNEHFSKDELVDSIFFQENSVLKFFSSKTSFNKAAEPKNKELLKNFYLNQGYIDFKLLNSKVEYDLKKNRTHITFEIDEGRQYKIKDISLISDFEIDEKVRKEVNKNIGEIYSQQKIDISRRIIKKYLTEKKFYSDIVIENKKLPNDEVNLIYKIKEVKSNFIEKIVILGNTRTKDSVIRNQVSLHEGDIFDVSEMQASYRRIYNLGFFETVDLDYQKDANNKITLTITVTEKKTGELNLGAGYSNLNGLFGKVYYLQNNLMGTGDTMDFGIEKGASSFRFKGSYFRQNVFDSLLGGGFGIFYSKDDNDKLDFKELEYGGKLMTSVPLYRDLTLGLQYSIKSTDIHNVSSHASQYIRDNQGKTISSTISYKVAYDKRDIIEYPLNGYYVLFSQNIAGLGGDKHYVSTELSTYFYKTLAYYNNSHENDDAIVFQFKNNAGYLKSYSGYNLRIEDRFFLSEVRGFEMISGISPRDREGKAIGGDEYIYGSAQIEFPIKFMKELNLKGHVFVDYGTTFNVNKLFLDKRLHIDEQLSSNHKSLRVSTGVGITMDTPIAPIGIDFGVPIVSNKSDIINHIYFSIAKRF
jgi:outer membrane protein insertion porin family